MNQAMAARNAARTAEEDEYGRALGRRLKPAARAAGLSSEALGKLLGVGAPTIRHWWAGRAQPSLLMLERYARVVGVPPGALAFGERGLGDLETLLLTFSQRVSLRGDARAAYRDLAPSSELSPDLAAALERLTPALVAILDQRVGGSFRRASKEAQRAAVEGLVRELLLLS